MVSTIKLKGKRTICSTHTPSIHRRWIEMNSCIFWGQLKIGHIETTTTRPSPCPCVTEKFNFNRRQLQRIESCGEQSRHTAWEDNRSRVSNLIKNNFWLNESAIRFAFRMKRKNENVKCRVHTGQPTESTLGRIRMTKDRNWNQVFPTAVTTRKNFVAIQWRLVLFWFFLVIFALFCSGNCWRASHVFMCVRIQNWRKKIDGHETNVFDAHNMAVYGATTIIACASKGQIIFYENYFEKLKTND